MMKLILLRHGQTQWNMAGKLQGWRDSPLTPSARRQLARLSRGTLQNTVIYSSDLGRAQASARIVANICSKHIVIDPRLRERCFGALDGQIIAKNKVGRLDWQAYHRRYQVPLTTISGAETESGLERRIISWLDDIQLKHQGGTVLVVSHGEWLRALRNIVDGIPSWHQGAGIMQNGVPTKLALTTKKGGTSTYPT